MFTLFPRSSLVVQQVNGALTLTLDGKPVITGPLAQYLLKSHTILRQDAPARDTIDVGCRDGSSVVDTSFWKEMIARPVTR